MSVLYFIGVSGVEQVKIGFANDLSKRLANLQCGCPLRLSVLAEFAGGAREEARVHKALLNYRCSGEWFEREAAMLLISDAKRLGLDSAIAIAEDRKAVDRALRAQHSASVRQHLVDRFGGGLQLPETHKIFNSLVADQHALDEVLAMYGFKLRPHMPALTALLKEADDLRGAA